MKIFLIGLLGVFGISAFGAGEPIQRNILDTNAHPRALMLKAPEFGDFNTDQFATNGNKVSVKSGALVTNLLVSDKLTISNSASLFVTNAGRVALSSNTNEIIGSDSPESGVNGIYRIRTIAGGVVDFTNSSANGTHMYIGPNAGGFGGEGSVSNAAAADLYLLSTSITVNDWSAVSGGGSFNTVYGTNLTTNLFPQLAMSGAFPPAFDQSTNWRVAPWGTDTYAQRGTAIPFRTIGAALAVAQSGEAVFVDAGYYPGGWDVPAGVHVIGAGSTVCATDGALSNDILFRMGDGSTISGMALGVVMPFKNNILRDVRGIGNQDGMIWQASGGGPFVAYNCYFESTYDSMNTVLTWAGGYADFVGCTFYAHDGVGRGVNNGAGYVRLFNCLVISSNGNLVTSCISIENAAATTELHGTELRFGSTNGNPAYAVNFVGAGTVIIDGTELLASQVNGTGNLRVHGGYFPTNSAPFTITTNDIPLNTWRTNGNQRATLIQSFFLTSALTGAATVSAYVDQDANGTFEQTGITASVGTLVAANGTFQLRIELQPLARFTFTNLSGAGATATVSGGSCQLTQW